MMHYNRQAAAFYARKWWNRRNPMFYDFENLGGDCTNFISQCLFAGCGVMNFTPVYGWYYLSLDRRSAAWSSAHYLYNFLVANTGPAVFGQEAPTETAQLGDVFQYSFDGAGFTHSALVVGFDEINKPLIAAHTFDSIDRPYDDYSYQLIRLIHIEGARI